MGDVAIVELEGGRTAAVPPLVLTDRSLAPDEALRLFGFPAGRPKGIWKVDLRWAGPMVGAWQQLIAHGNHDYKLQHGFSGCPVIDLAGEVVGILAQAEDAPDVDAASFIPIAVAGVAVCESDGIVLPITKRQAKPTASAEPALGRPMASVRAPLPTIWNLPPLRNPNFIGRGGDISKLQDALANHRAVVLTGLAGVGKSQLAVQFAHKHAAAYDLVWWITADQPAALVRDMAALAERLGLSNVDLADQPSAAEAARRRLEQTDGWLLVFDNALDPQSVKSWVPQSDTGHTVITSRHAAWGATAHTAPLGSLGIEDAARLLRRWGAHGDDDAARVLAKELGGLPLALEQAGAYMEATGTTLSDYLGLFASRRKELLAHHADSHTRTVAATWELAFDELDRRSPSASALLNAAALLAPDDIPRSLFVDNSDLPQALKGLGDALAFGDALAALTRYSLLSPTGDAFAVHRLVQAVARDRLGDEGAQIWIEAVIDLLAGSFRFQQTNPSTWRATGRIVPHVLRACQHAQRAPVAERGLTEPLHHLLNAAGMYLVERAQFGQAQEAIERALAIDKAVHGLDHPNVATDLSNLGAVLRERGDLDGAKAAFERALAIDEDAYGPDHPRVATDLSNLGVVLRWRGDLDGAEAAFKRALAIDDAEYGPSHPMVAIRLNNLGGLLREQGDLSGARVAFERALGIDEAEYGPNHPRMATGANNLGLVLRDLADLDGAQAAFERALAIDESEYGLNHPRVATDVSNVGLVLTERGDLAGAQAAFERALAIAESSYGPDHPEVATVVNNLGEALRASGDLAGAEAAFRRALTIDEAAYGPYHAVVSIRVNNLGVVLLDRRDLGGAEAAFRRSLTIDEAAYGPNHSRVATVLSNLGAVLLQRGKLDAAQTALRRAYSILESTLGPDHALAQTVRSLLDQIRSPRPPARRRAGKRSRRR